MNGDPANAPASPSPPAEGAARMDTVHQMRVIEAVLFAASDPLSEKALAARLPEGADIRAILARLERDYAARGVNLMRAGDLWAFRTAADLARELAIEVEKPKKPTRAALETLAIIAYHQPVTRAEIEQVRGVTLSRGTLDALLEAGWIQPRGRKRIPGRPILWATTDGFLDHFGLQSRDDLPGIAELKAAGLLDARPGTGAYEPDGDGLPPSVETAAAETERAEAAVHLAAVPLPEEETQ